MNPDADHPNVDYERNIASYSEADRLYEEGKFVAALKSFKASLAADSSDGDALHAIGSCYDALKMPASAAAAYRQALELLPPTRHPALHFNIGNALFDLGRYQESLAEYHLIPKDSSVWHETETNIRLASERVGSGG